MTIFAEFYICIYYIHIIIPRRFRLSVNAFIQDISSFLLSSLNRVSWRADGEDWVTSNEAGVELDKRWSLRGILFCSIISSWGEPAAAVPHSDIIESMNTGKFNDRTSEYFL